MIMTVNKNGFAGGVGKRITVDVKPNQDLSGINFSGRSFSGMDLSGVNFSWSNLRGCDFSGTNMHNTDLRHALIRGTNFANSSGELKNSILIKNNEPIRMNILVCYLYKDESVKIDKNRIFAHFGFLKTEMVNNRVVDNIVEKELWDYIDGLEYYDEFLYLVSFHKRVIELAALKLRNRKYGLGRRG